MPERPDKTRSRKPSAPAKAAAELQTPHSQPQTNFYEKVLDEAEKIDFAAAWGKDSIDDEIALLRVKIKEIIQNNPDNIRLLLQATNMLTKLMKARYNMNKGQKKSLGEAVRKVITEIGVPLGVAALNKKL